MIERSKRWWLGWLAGTPLHARVHLVVGLVAPAWVLASNMWRVRAFTVDDSYISFRYARNLANGLGLVYNPGEAVEGYTNFLWTVAIAGGIELGVDPHATSKWLGALAGVATLAVVYRLSARMRPFTTVPCIATWLLASSPTFVSWSMFGLESSLFAFFVALGTLMMFEEHARGRGIPWSGLVFALAGLTRPEAPMFMGLPMLLLGRAFFARQNLVRGVLFAAPLAIHILWRHSYYGEWLPGTLSAKTGDLALQWKTGTRYVLAWVATCGPILFMSMYAAAAALVRRERELGTLVVLTLAVGAYVILVGGDWMSYHRFMVPAEPFAFVLVCVAVREIAATRDRIALVALALLLVWQGVHRWDVLGDSRRKFLKEERRFWDKSAGKVAKWFEENGKPGRVALGDIGYIGWSTDYPVLDLLGLVDPVIGDLPGGYTKKLGPGLTERFYELMPEWGVLIFNGEGCDTSTIPAVKLITEDPRFAKSYREMAKFKVSAQGTWCIFKRKGF
jgi:arabinofuranosyltransferase